MLVTFLGICTLKNLKYFDVRQSNLITLLQILPKFTLSIFHDYLQNRYTWLINNLHKLQKKLGKFTKINTLNLCLCKSYI